jgi:hypothetical protein
LPALSKQNTNALLGLVPKTRTPSCNHLRTREQAETLTRGWAQNEISSEKVLRIQLRLTCTEQWSWCGPVKRDKRGRGKRGMCLLVEKNLKFHIPECRAWTQMGPKNGVKMMVEFRISCFAEPFHKTRNAHRISDFVFCGTVSQNSKCTVAVFTCVTAPFHETRNTHLQCSHVTTLHLK